jgi:hypothetical protein
MHRGQRYTFFAAAVFLIGAFMPWLVITAPGGEVINRNALALPNGLGILGIGLLAAITGLIYRGVRGKIYSLPLVILSGAGAVMIGLIAAQTSRFAGNVEPGSVVRLGSGMFVSFVATLGMLFGAMQRSIPPTTTK